MQITLRNAKCEATRTVEAFPVELNGFQLAVHQGLNGDQPSQWRVSDPVSGFAFAPPARTRKQAIENAKTRFADYPVERIRIVIACAQDQVRRALKG